MPTEPPIELLRKHSDLLPPGKREVATWLLSREPGSKELLPRGLQRRVWTKFHYDLRAADSADRLLRELVLELLSRSRPEILRRRRTGATSGVPLGPRKVKP
jgi:hypothetical protein